VAPLEPGIVEVSASAPSIRVVVPIDFKRADPTAVSLGASLRTFKANSARVTDLKATLSRADAGLPSINTEVLLSTCCPQLETNGADCSRYLTVPASTRSTVAAPSILPFEGRLTAEGEGIVAQTVTVPTSKSIFVVAALASTPAPQCSSDADAATWLSMAGDGATRDVVELRLEQATAP
jgi:hypothetical protein